MKKNTKLLLGAGAALGIGYLLFRKGDGKTAGLGALSQIEMAEFAEFDNSGYWFENGARDDYTQVLKAIGALRGIRISYDQGLAEYAQAVGGGMPKKGYDLNAELGRRGLATSDANQLSMAVELYGPHIEAALARLGGGSGGSSDGGGQSSGGQSGGGGDTATGYIAEGGACTLSYECAGNLTCESGKCARPAGGTDTGTGGKKSSGGSGSSGGTGTGTGTTTRTGGGDTKPPALTPPKKQDDGGIGIGTIALALAAGGVVWFLLKTDDTKVVKLRAEGAAKAREVGARAAGAASRKLSEYQRRMQNGSGVNGLRRRRKSRR
jgi:hypothetical protein